MADRKKKQKGARKAASKRVKTAARVAAAGGPMGPPFGGAGGEITEPVPFDGMSGTGTIVPVPSDLPPPRDLRATPEGHTVMADAAIVSERLAAVDTVDAEVVPPPPPQGVGPHFEIGDAGVITLAPPEALDRHGNNVRRLRSLHPKLCDLSRELVRYLSAGNIPHRHLYDRVEGYRQIIEHDLDTIDFSLLYVEGVRLANAAAANAAEADRGELPPLDEPVRERLDTLLQLHGTFMLFTVEGIEAIAAEERYQRRPDEETAYREAAIEVAASLQHKPEVIEASAAAVVLGAAEQIGQGANPERSGVVGTGTLRNVTIILAVAAAVAALPIVGGLELGSAGFFAGGQLAFLMHESLKKSKPYGRIIAPITGAIDAVAEAHLAKVLPELKRWFNPQLVFVRSLEPKLRLLASQNEQFAWINEILDRLKGPPANSIFEQASFGPGPAGGPYSPPPSNRRTAPGLEASKKDPRGTRPDRPPSLRCR